MPCLAWKPDFNRFSLLFFGFYPVFPFFGRIFPYAVDNRQPKMLAILVRL